MNENSEIAEVSSASKSFFSISKTTKVVKTVNTYNVYMHHGIFMSEDLCRLLDLFRSVEKDDVIRLYINSPGGRLDTTLSILNAMSECKGTIVTIADGKVQSAATFLFLAGDEYVIYDFSYFMFHQYSGGARGKGQDMKDSIDFKHDHYEKFFKHYYGQLFTNKEIKKMLYGKDKWVGKDEMNALLGKVPKSKGKKIDKAPKSN
jgi:ATP-dependent protease ClpP protease subunit